MAEHVGFWQALDHLVTTGELVVDRPRGSRHPRHPEFVYPLDYGYLAGTRGGDGAGVDVWMGSRPQRGTTGIICTVDLAQGNAEVKILLGCTPEESRQILDSHNMGQQSAVLVERGVAGEK